MFGYVQIRKAELKIKDFELYHGFYCGLCNMLKDKYGLLGELTLTYDMTFLVILLSSVYELPVTPKRERCLIHPAKKHLKLTTEATEYAAHLNLLLSYYHFLDDIKDDGSKKARISCKLYENGFRKADQRYAEKSAHIKLYLKQLSAMEKNERIEVHELAGCFGNIMKILFSYRKDVFEDYLMDLGYYLGRYIYIMDAYDDLFEDMKKKRYNPLKKLYKEQKHADISLSEHSETTAQNTGFMWKQYPAFDKKIEDMLLDEISSAAAAYQKLPCLAYKDILGNILYAGVWNRFDQIKRERGGKKK